jgi:uridine kinase
MSDSRPPITVRLDGRPPFEIPPGTLVSALPGIGEGEGPLAYLGALVNNDVVPLAYPLEVDCDVELLTIRHPLGWRIYRNSVSFLLAMAVHQLLPDSDFAVEGSLGSGYYCRLGRDDTSVDQAKIEAIEKRMRELVARNLPIVRRKIAFGDAVRQFEAERQTDKFDLLRFRNPAKVTVYTADGFTDLYHGALAPRTGALAYFALFPNPPGFVVQFPEREQAPDLAPLDPQPNLVQIFEEQERWGRIVGVRTVGDLNRLIAQREIGETVRIAEAFHEKKITRIADRIAERRPETRWVLIAGPSSSGKTTFTKRLDVGLRVDGLRTVAISVDDYFVDRDKTPRDEGGDLDFEHIETVDLPLLNEHLAALDRGEEVALPTFNFSTGQREFRGKKLRLEPDQLALVEGIHCLNPRLTESIPARHKFRIYVSALTQLNLDYHNRVATTDNRLIRRMVRDHRFRGHDALRTLGMWTSVRRGEKRWIFPFQSEADAVFNSALDYELAVLKPFVEPLLLEVKPYHTQYAEARRLMSFLEMFLATADGLVPPNSILREFIGSSTFRYD